jgi:ABC-type multidrug transport system fused ATPase/permease subunit
MFGEFEDAALADAIQKSGLAALVEEKGLDYDCAEAGKNLSGGEKQRVSIARCLIRKTPVLLVDEATAALDNETANSVESAILGIKDTTKIVVTHRFNESVMKQYDNIIVLNRGQVVESGCFEELMDRKGYFYSLFTVAQGE